jgi:hypothetical protein
MVRHFAVNAPGFLDQSFEGVGVALKIFGLRTFRGGHR